MTNQTFTIHATLMMGFLAATIAIVFGFVLPRIVDHAINRNVKILQELIAIRKEMDAGDPDAERMDEIISYRRKGYLKRQIASYETMKNEDEYDAAKAVLRRNAVRRFWWKITSHQFTLGTGSVVSIFVVCICFSIWVSGVATDIIVK